MADDKYFHGKGLASEMQSDHESVRRVNRRVPPDARETSRNLDYYLRNPNSQKPAGYGEFLNQEGYLPSLSKNEKYYEAQVGRAREGDMEGEAGKRRVVHKCQLGANGTRTLNKYYSDCHYNDRNDKWNVAFYEF